MAEPVGHGTRSSATAVTVLHELKLPADLQPQLFVVVDTEEEFDWSAPFSRVSRANTAVTAMKHVHRVQSIFDRFRITPTYVIDYPVASQADGYRPLQEIARDGRCRIGAHLHPWVNPPYDEEPSSWNSFTMNLPPSLQSAKLHVLRETIGERFDESPTVFKAGRYGLGVSTVGLLDQMGFDVDASVCPRMDFSAEGGPDFGHFDSSPFFLTRRLLELPCTLDFTGWAGRWRPSLHRLASTVPLSRLRAVGVCAKAGAVNKIMLSPEGNTFEEMRSLASMLFQVGCRTFTLSFHSPSVEPGHTPYVRTRADLDVFLRDVERFCDFFLTDLKGQPATPQAFRATANSFLGAD